MILSRKTLALALECMETQIVVTSIPQWISSSICDIYYNHYWQYQERS